ncbi:hypothetical protein F0P94_17035 [Adhaeribacter soli]|uniref:DUF5666 domain-containing protein n=2 Tax=Adhaeribacter soli TaxID=2607655 RepID=A0A5N1IQ94_9BACT|nr:hypothetical protein F0P94_17035 [Adhaeribacter soli]
MFLTIPVILASCNLPNNPENPEMQQEEVKSQTDFISGKVTEIQPGKDGYTARIKTAEGQEYLATVSHANLTDPTTYRAVTVGETVRVKGDHWEMENQQHITVRELK